MRYVKEGVVYTLTDIRRANPQTSFPKGIFDPTGLGYDPLSETPVPSYNKLTHKVSETNPIIINNHLVQVWEVIELTSEESAVAITNEKTTLKDQLATIRFQKETAGITFNGMEVATDRPSQAMLTGAYTTVQVNPEMIIDWKGESGWVQLNKTAIEMLSQVVANHIQACFTNEKNISALIDAATTVAELEAVDLNGGWPV